MPVVKPKKKEKVKENTVTAKVTRTNPTKDDPKPTKTYMYTVESGIIVSGARHTIDDLKFPFELMKPGDSFLIPANDPAAKSANTLHYAAKAYARIKPGFTITSRIQLNKSRRVWRLK